VVTAAGLAPRATPPMPSPPSRFSEPVRTTCVVEENGHRRAFRITIEPPEIVAKPAVTKTAVPVATCEPTPIFSPFEGKVQLVEINVRVGEPVVQGQVVAAVEAMKAKHEIKSTCAGRVVSVDATIGSDVTAETPILTIGA
jgi:biotin carboxyl carrier protein